MTAFRSAALVLGAAITVLCVRDGTPGWMAVRLALLVGLITGALLLHRRGGPIAQAVICVLLGIAGTIPGLAIGLVRLLRGELSVVSVAGLVCLVTGLALLSYGSVQLIRGLHGWWRLAALPVAFLVLAFVLVPLTIAVYATNVPANDLGTATPATRGMAYESVTLRTTGRDRVRLSGWYVPSRNGAAVVLLHGSGSTRSNVLDHAAVLARRGYGALLLDTRGHGRSGGDAMDFGWYGDRDVDAAVTFLSGRADVRNGRIAVVGLSMGGEQAITVAASDRRIKAVVAEGVTRRVLADDRWLPGGLNGAIQRGMDWVQFTAADLISGAGRPIGLREAVVRTAPRPILIISAGNVYDEAVAARFYRAAAPASVQWWNVPNTAHTRGLATHPAEWESRVVTFLGRALPG